MMATTTCKLYHGRSTGNMSCMQSRREAYKDRAFWFSLALVHVKLSEAREVGERGGVFGEERSLDKQQYRITDKENSGTKRGLQGSKTPFMEKRQVFKKTNAPLPLRWQLRCGESHQNPEWTAASHTLWTRYPAAQSELISQHIQRENLTCPKY